MGVPVQIVGLGELLWDLLPGGRQLGGAPTNFAFHCHQLGHPTVVASRVGMDADGADLRRALLALGLSDAFVQDDPDHPTGTVSVLLEAGQPTYTIHEGVAWDYLDVDEHLLSAVRFARVVCFGSLVQRYPVARFTVQELLRQASGLLVCDINLRQTFWSREVIETSFHASHWVKLNEDELTVLTGELGLSGKTVSERLANLRARYAVERVALTRGERGCLVQTADEEIDLPGIPVQVVDTVGAGDAFTAGLVCATQRGHSLAEATAFANRLAARVAGCAGGTPRLPAPWREMDR